MLLLLTVVCTSCRLQHTKTHIESDFDDGGGGEKVCGIPNLQCKGCSSVFLLIVMSVDGCQCVRGTRVGVSQPKISTHITYNSKQLSLARRD